MDKTVWANKKRTQNTSKTEMKKKNDNSIEK